MTSTWKKLLAFTTLAASAALAKPCVGFDSYFNLYVFGGATDYALGPQDAWFNSSELSFRASSTGPGYNRMVAPTPALRMMGEKTDHFA